MPETRTLTSEQRTLVSTRIKRAREWMDRRQTLSDNDTGKFPTRSDRNLALVSGQYWPKINPEQKVVGINHLRTALMVKLSALAGGDTHFIASAREDRFQDMEDRSAGLLNDYWDSLGYDRECDMACWDSMIHPTGGLVEVGWQYKDANIEQVGRPSELEIADAEAKNAPEEEALPPDVMEAYAGEVEPVPSELLEESALTARANVIPETDEPFVERFDSRCLFIDPNARRFDLSDARYVFRQKWVLLTEVKANARYRNKSKLKGVTYAYDRERERSRKQDEGGNDDIKYVELFDGYAWLPSREGGEQLWHIVFAPETDKELLCEEPPYPYFEGPGVFPFTIMPGFQPDNDVLDFVADVEKARDLQVTHDLAFTQVEWARAHSPNVLVVTTGTFAGDEGLRTKKRIESGHENAVLEVDPAYFAQVRWLERPPLHADAFEALENVPAKILDAIGVSEYQANQLPTKELTKYEVRSLEAQGGTRQELELERYYNFIERVAYKVLVLCQQFQTREAQYSHVNPAGDRQWGSADVATLRGFAQGGTELEKPGVQMKIALDVSKKRGRNEAQDRNDLVELVKLLAPAAEAADPRLPSRPLLNVPHLLRLILKTYPAVGDVDEVVPPDPSPEEVQQFQMQQQMAMREQMQMQQTQEAQARGAEEQDRQGKMLVEGLKLGSRAGG